MRQGYKELTSTQPMLYMTCWPPHNPQTFSLKALFVFLICLYDPSPGCCSTFLQGGGGWQGNQTWCVVEAITAQPNWCQSHYTIGLLSSRMEISFFMNYLFFLSQLENITDQSKTISGINWCSATLLLLSKIHEQNRSPLADHQIYPQNLYQF